MPLPDLSVLCIPSIVLERNCIIFPGDAKLCVSFPSLRIPDPSELVTSLLGPVNAALAPLTPIFDIIEVIIALVDCVKAVEKAIAHFPPRPDKLAKCFPNLAKKVAKLLKLIPALSVPILVGSILDALIAFMKGYRNILLAIIKKSLQLLAAEIRAGQLKSLQLDAVVQCAKVDLDNFFENARENAKPIGQLIQILNGLLQLAGIGDEDHPPIPAFSQDGGVATLIVPIDNMIFSLQAIRNSLP